MKARITQMKAPWPSGAVVGAVVMFASGSLPAWAAGKCELVGDEEEAAHVVEPAAPAVAAEASADPVEAVRAEAQAFIDRLRASHEAQVAELQGSVQAKAAELETALAQVAELQAQLQAATKSKGK